MLDVVPTWEPVIDNLLPVDEPQRVAESSKPTEQNRSQRNGARISAVTPRANARRREEPWDSDIDIEITFPHEIAGR